ncbi:MAG: MCP four helix bundle domain-containing protein [Leptospiraceae bacterium]|nr:MCP four helix bundle domain-containing protein [Leptospiraceae bacterium]
MLKEIDRIKDLYAGNSSLRARLIVSQVIVIIFLIIFGSISIYLVDELFESSKVISDRVVPLVEKLYDINDKVGKMRRHEMLYSLSSPDTKDVQLKKIKDFETEAFGLIEQLKAINSDSNIISEKHLSDLDKSFKNYSNNIDIVIEVFKYSTITNVESKQVQNSINIFTDLMTILGTCADEAKSASEKKANSSKILYNSNLSLTITVLVIIIIFLGIYSYKTIKNIVGPLKKAVEIISEFSEGNLKKDIPSEKMKEYNQMFTAMEKMSTKLSDAVFKIRQVSDGILSSSGNLQSGSEKLSGFAQEMAASSEQGSSSIEELRTSLENVGSSIGIQSVSMESIDRNIQSMSKAILDIKKSVEVLATQANNASGKASGGEAIISKTESSMDNIKNSSSQITKIIGLISDISSQTNLLALNAAIEAARAGEAGQGFAVVADNISKLAEKTNISVKQIQTLIQSTDQSIKEGYSRVGELSAILRNIIDSINTINSSANSVLGSVGQQAQRATNIADNVKEAAQISKEIDNASHEQKGAIKEVNHTILNISNISNTISHESQGLKTLSYGLKSQSEELKDSVDFFKV